MLRLKTVLVPGGRVDQVDTFEYKFLNENKYYYLKKLTVLSSFHIRNFHWNISCAHCKYCQFRIDKTEFKSKEKKSSHHE